MGPLDKLETYLVGVSKQLPQIPKNAKKVIADIAPWFVLVFGLFYLWTAWVIWEWARVTNVYVDWANRFNEAMGAPTVSVSRFTIWVWITLAVAVSMAALFFIAFPALRKFSKKGWNILFVVSFLSLVYGIISLFNNYGGFGSLFMSFLSTAIFWYLLFQIRELYLGKKAHEDKKVEEAK